MIKNGAAFDRLAFFVLMLFLMSHLVGCLWIFTGKTFEDPDVEGDSWIEACGFQEMNMMELYAASMYFSMQTLTTVGYGDIRIVQTEERVLCILLEFVGVIFFSFAAGSLTQLISNFDSENSANVEKDEVLNRILKEYHIPTDLYV